MLAIKLNPTKLRMNAKKAQLNATSDKIIRNNSNQNALKVEISKLEKQQTSQLKALVQGGKAGWVNDPDNGGSAVLVEANTGARIRKMDGDFVIEGKVSKAPTPFPMAQYKQDLLGSENRESNMYKDSQKYVTVGIGHKVPNEQHAVALHHGILPFSNNGKPATDQDVIIDYQKAKAQGRGDLEVQGTDIDALFNRDINQKINELRATMAFPDFESYPESVKLALLDMAFNVGATGLVTKFPNLTAAAKRRDWTTAANESNRPQVQPPRNQATLDKFNAAAQIEPFFIRYDTSSKAATLGKLLTDKGTLILW